MPPCRAALLTARRFESCRRSFCSLYQHERTPEQQTLFIQGLGSINLLYAHQTVVIWCLTRVPAHVPTGYHFRGWTTFEQTVGTAIKKNHYHLDFGRLQCEPEAITDWVAQVEDVLDDGRLPPPTEERFGAILATKKFTNGRTDHELVLGLYRTFLHEALGGVEVLDFSDLGWRDAQMEALGEALALCTRLHSLNLYGNDVGDSGLSALARSVPPTLESLGLAANHKISDVGAADLAVHIGSCMPRLRQLDLSSTVRRPRLQCADAPCTDAPRTFEAVEEFVRYYGSSASERERLHVEARETASRSLWRASFEQSLGRPTVLVEGVQCHRRLTCDSGALMQDAWREAIAGRWILSEVDPLVDGAPHYERKDDDGDVSHLYRCLSMRGTRVWYVGPTPAAEGGVAAAWDEALHPQDIQVTWDVTTETTWVNDPTFHFAAAEADGPLAPLVSADGSDATVPMRPVEEQALLISEGGTALNKALNEAELPVRSHSDHTDETTRTATASSRQDSSHLRTPSKKPLPEASRRLPMPRDRDPSGAAEAFPQSAKSPAARRRLLSSRWREQRGGATASTASAAVHAARKVVGGKVSRMMQMYNSQAT